MLFTTFILFMFGLAIGSFLNVVTLRYDPDGPLFDLKKLGGRSHCPRCHTTLGALELVPLMSFIFQRGRCKHCGAKISWQYPVVELISGLIFVFVPGVFAALPPSPFSFLLPVLWVLVFLSFLILSVVDFREQIIPDEMNVFIGICGVLITWILSMRLQRTTYSFLGPYAPFFGGTDSLWVARLYGFLFGLLFFGALIVLTRGKGMGMGDLKLSMALGILLGWPDVLMIYVFAFILGAIAGVPAMIWGGKKLKSSLPFGPFIVLGAALVFFYGQTILGAYFALLGI